MHVVECRDHGRDGWGFWFVCLKKMDDPLKCPVMSLVVSLWDGYLNKRIYSMYPLAFPSLSLSLSSNTYSTVHSKIKNDTMAIKVQLLFVLAVMIVLMSVSGVESQSLQRGASRKSYKRDEMERQLKMGGKGGKGMKSVTTPPVPTATPSASLAPSRTPSGAPSGAPSVSLAPSRTPSGAPSGAPSVSLAPSTSQAPSSTMMSKDNIFKFKSMGMR